ncbi:hypothetical protein VNI00_004590 [Paramarasmius palmivorus]|uniref:Uncharacterized protein n=1 Tax=Paramarasmius palmivorus TaxID=297713 RepID=A0AAW0DFI0_9AGAR
MADLLVYLLQPDGTHLIFNCVLPKLYTISLLSSLNARRGWKYESESTSRRSQNDFGLRRFIQSENVDSSSNPRPEASIL